MAQAKISINGVDGSNDDLPINTLVQLNNHNTGGESTYAWAILDQPPGTADTLSANNIQNPTFTPKKEGTYLIQEIVNQGTGTEHRDVQIVGIRQLKTHERVPAAGEEAQDDAVRGWAGAAGSFLQRVDNRYGGQGGVLAAVNASGGSIARGTVVQLDVDQVIKSGLPGVETLPGFIKADNSTGIIGTDPQFDQPLFIVEGTPAGGNSVASGGVGLLRLFGIMTGLTTAAPQNFLTQLYVKGDGSGDLAPLATILSTQSAPRVVAMVVKTGNPYDIYFNGLRGLQRPQHIFFGNGSTPNVAGTTFLSPCFNPNVSPATEAAIPMGLSGVVYRLRATARTGTTGGNLVLTLRKNGVDQTPTCTLAAGTTNQNPDQNTLFSIGAADRLSIKAVAGGGTSAGAADLVASFFFIPYQTTG